MMAGTTFALIWANLDHVSYHDMVHGEYEGHVSLHFLVTDVGMAFFFGIAAKEIREAMLPGGSLSSIRRAATPLVATLAVPRRLPGEARSWVFFLLGEESAENRNLDQCGLP